MTGNPLAPELVAADTNGRLLPFLQALAEDGISVAEGKPILVGEGEAGKSTLLAALRGEPFRPDRSATHGLEVKTMEITGSSGELALRAWDFGGQAFSVFFGILPPMPMVTTQTFYGDVENIASGMIPRVYGRSYAIEAELTVP